MSCKIIQLDENATGFMCKLDTNECAKGGECDSDGEAVLFGSDGEIYKQSDCPEGEAGNIFYQERKINGGACTCSKCGKPFSPPMF